MKTIEIDPSKKCEFCDKRGLPILPVRYTVAPNSTNAPKLSGTFAVDEVPIQGNIHYTTRLLRTGYLYTYDEARNRWEGYYITQHGNFMIFNTEKPLPKAYVGRVPCESSGHPQIAGMITVPDPKNATFVWLAYSEVEWTAAVFTKNEDPAWRAKHMQKVDIEAALKSTSQPHTQPLSKIGSLVGEHKFTPTNVKNDPFLSGSPFEYQSKTLDTEKTIQVAEGLRPGKAIAVALHDPVGMQHEVVAAMQVILEQQTELLKTTDNGIKKTNPHGARKIAVASLISQMRESIQKKAENDRIEKMIDDRRSLLMRTPISQWPEAHKNTAVSPSMLDDERQKAWAKYQAKFNEAEADKVKVAYDQALQNITKTHITPVAEFHAAWLTHERMAQYYICNFDPQEPKSGLGYTASVCALIENSQGTKPAFEAIKAMLNGDSFAPTNYLLRASILNQDALAEKIQDVVSFDPRAIPWDQPNAVYKGMLESLRKSGQRPAGVIARYVVATMGPMVNAANATINGTAKLAMLATGLHSGGWKLIEFEGNKRDLHKAITRMVIESAKTPLDRGQIQKAVEMEMHRAEIRGVKFKNSHEKIKVRWLTGIDLKAASQGKVKLGLDELRFQRFTRVLDTDVKLGAVASAMQFWCITKTIADYENAIAADKTENGWRLVGSALGIAGGLMELCSDILERAMKYSNLRQAQGVSATTIKVLRYGGKALGIIGALIAAVWDLVKAHEEFQKNNTKVGWLFLGSAAFGLTASIMMAFFASNPITWLVVGVFIGITIWLDRDKDSTIQIWLENCVFGKRPSPIYDIEPEKELQDYAKMMS